MDRCAHGGTEFQNITQEMESLKAKDQVITSILWDVNSVGEKCINHTDQSNELDAELPEFIEVTDVLDLHGFYPEQVPEIVTDFIDNALELKLFRLRIIHGKGKSRLKWEVYQVLKENPHVAWFGDAPPDLGGWGATIVELKKEAH